MSALSVSKSHKREPSGSFESVRVMVRFRPTNKSEKAKAAQIEPWKTLQATDKGHRIQSGSGADTLRLNNIVEHGASNISFRPKTDKFTFDAVMDADTTQVEAFEKVAQKICDEILQGYNGTIFVYGQSGSGKTHTMYGPEEKKDSFEIQEMGVIPQSCAYIFAILNQPNHRLVNGMESHVVQCEFIEIYNNTVKDLLNPRNKPQIKQRKVPKTKDEWKVVVEGVETRQVFNLGEILKAIRDASKNRTVAKTNLNATSSRSHMIMRLIVKITTKDGGERTGVGNFADLAGSEKVKKTGARGQQLKEAQGILSSLSTLSAVIKALVEGRNPPFQESKLTFALKDSLGGNSKTALLIACSPHVFNRVETLNSLKFGDRCKRIKNKAKVNVKMTRAQLEAENEKLQEEIARLRSGTISPKKSSTNSIEIVSEPVIDPTVSAKLEQLEQIEQETKRMEDEIERLETTNHKLNDELEQREHLQVEMEQIQADVAQKQRDYDSLMERLKEKEQEVESVNERIMELERDRERISKQRDELTQSRTQLMVEKKRLFEVNQKQKEEVDRWRKEVDRMKESESALREKWAADLESKKSQFTQQELQLSQRIEAMQSTMKEHDQYRVTTQRELKLNAETLRQRQDRIHELEDELRALRSRLEEEKMHHAESRSENEQLKSKIEGLESKLRTLRLANAKEENQHNEEVDTLRMKMNEMENEMEIKDSKASELENRMEAMERAHAKEMNNMRQQMAALRELNVQLQEENRTAFDVMHRHKKSVRRQRESLTLVQEEKDIIARQLEQLQSHYQNVVRQQIEDDARLARKLQNDYNQEDQRIRKRQATAKRKKHRKKESKNLKVAVHGNHDGDDTDSEDELLIGDGHVTPMGNGHTPGMSGSPSIELMSDEDSENEQQEPSLRPLAESKEESEDTSDTEDDIEEIFYEKATLQSKSNKKEKSPNPLSLQQPLSDDEHRTSQFAAYTEQYSHIDVDENIARSLAKQEEEENRKKMEMEGAEREKQRRMHQLRNSVSVADLHNNDMLTPKGGNKWRKTKKVKRMEHRLNLSRQNVDLQQNMLTDEEEDDGMQIDE